MTVGSKVLQKRAGLWRASFQGSVLGSLRLWCSVLLLFMGDPPVFRAARASPSAVLQVCLIY